MNVLWAGLLCVVLLASATLGWVAQHRLHERFRSRDTVESTRLMMGMLLTFSALVLGLLTSSAKQRFDGLNHDLGAFATALIEVDHGLQLYGPDARPIRGLLRRYTAAALADTWPSEPAPAGDYPRLRPDAEPGSLESRALGALLFEVEAAIGRLAPEDAYHRFVSDRLQDRVAAAVQQRWQLVFTARSTISLPFLVILTSWLSIIFAIFGLTTPRNRLVCAVMVLAALSIASPLYLILEYDQATGASLQLSSEPMRAALAHMDE